MEAKKALRNIGLSLCALISTSLLSQKAEAIMSDSCERPERVKWSETYMVQNEGENLWTIADRIYGTRIKYDPLIKKRRHFPTEIAQYNGIPAPYHIRQGQRLEIPHERTVMVSSDVCALSGYSFFERDFNF